MSWTENLQPERNLQALWFVLVFGHRERIMKISLLKNPNSWRPGIFRKKPQRILFISVSKYVRSQTVGSMSNGQTAELAPAPWC